MVAAALLAAGGALAAAQGVAGYEVQGDAIAQPLDGLRGDAQRGRAIVASRQSGLCLLCHSAPVPEERFQGDLAPALAGVGARYSEGQLRLRVVDPRRVNPASFMPAFHSAHNPSRVGGAWAGKPILTAQQVEDVVAWLATLR
jgi:sulfur-oxidizing protein SoxX